MFVEQGSRAGSAVAQHWEASMVRPSLRGQGTHVNHVHPIVVITQIDTMTCKKSMVIKGKCYFTFVAKECNYFAKRKRNMSEVQLLPIIQPVSPEEIPKQSPRIIFFLLF